MNVKKVAITREMTLSSGKKSFVNTQTGQCHRYSEYDQSPIVTSDSLYLENLVEVVGFDSLKSETKRKIEAKAIGTTVWYKFA